MTTTLVVQQPTPVMQVIESDGWGSGVFDCFNDLGECCFAYWLFPCYACMKSRDFGECLCLPLLDYCGGVPPITLALRVSMRHRYGIKGSILDDCVFATFCTACIWCQMSREMKRRSSPITIINTVPKL
ncbi:cornifelin homolog B-like [Chanos chanos]|uniref:Cornifelin homolog B-like n=1 Tax=Chanos chanos TaxID=29144 RepID=A0A6J2WX48_CHACN|nr:cornifelin homolog B-like [Chanos chanos]